MPHKTREERLRYLKEYNHRRYADPEWSHRQYLRVKARKDRILVWFKEMKGTLKCNRCPEDEPFCLDFHHKDRRDKDIMLSQAVKRGWSIERILREMAKCEVLCANCHRKEHKDDQ